MPKNQFDQIVDNTVRRMMEFLEQAPESEQPFDSKKLSKREQLMQYLQARNDPVAARQIVDTYGIKGAVEYVETMERYLKGVLSDASEHTEHVE